MRMFEQPRPVPESTLPTVAAGFVVALAFPVFLVTGWRVQGWALGAVLWLGSMAFGWVLQRMLARTGNLAAAGVVAFGMMFRAVAVMLVAFVVAVADPWLGVTAALVYALGYTVELGLSLVTYFGVPAR